MRFKFWLTGPLFDEAGDGTGGGGDGSGTGKSGAAAFDAAAFKTELMGDITKMVQGALKAQKTDFAKLISGSQQKQGEGQGGGAGDGSGDGSGAGAGDGQGDGKVVKDPVVASEMRRLTRENKELKDQFTAMKTESDTTKADADKKDLNSQVRSKLATKFKFADDGALEDAFEIFSPKVKRDENGAIVGHDGTPLDQYLDEQMRNRAYLLATKDVSGAGARNGSKVGKRTFTLEDVDNIKTLSAEDQVKLRSHIAASMVDAQSGR